MSTVELHFVEGFALAAAPGVEEALSKVIPAFAAGWVALQVVLPTATLEPLFAGASGLSAAAITDLMDAARMAGEAPPDLLRWFSIECPENLLETVVPLVAGLPLVDWSGVRPETAGCGFRDGTVSWGTNPNSGLSLHLQRSPLGVDVLHAWQIAGGTGIDVKVADVEKGFWVEHIDLRAARIRVVAVSPKATEEDKSHGTSVAGLLVGSDDQVSSVGVVPDAELLLISILRASTVYGWAAIIVRAAHEVGPGGVVLLEEGILLKPISKLKEPGLTAPLETNFVVHQAIKYATALGVTVVEAAGNSGIDLDDPPTAPDWLAHSIAVDLSLPSWSDSGAIIVGGGDKIHDPEGWQPYFMSVRGERVDCYAQATNVFAAIKADGASAYDYLSGTSWATAIVAGVVAAIQGMAKAHRGRPLAPRYIRDLLRDRRLGTPMWPGYGGMGSMPDLRRIARSQRWPRIVPVAAVALGSDAAVLVYLDEEDRLERRHFSFWTGWGQALRLVPTPGEVWPARPAVLSWAEPATGRLVYLALMGGRHGLYQLAWDSGAMENLTTVQTSSGDTIAPGKSPAVVRPAEKVLVVVGVATDGRMVAFSAKPLDDAFSGPAVLDPDATFCRTTGPAAVSAAPGKVDAVAISDDGVLTWFHGKPTTTGPTGWLTAVSEPTGEFVPGAGAAALAVDGRVLVAAVGIEGWLYTLEINPKRGAVPAAISAPQVMDVATTFATQGPLALARLTTATTDLVLAFGVDTDGFVRVSSRAAAGGDWSALLVVSSGVKASPLGGVVAITAADLGVLLFVVGMDGVVRTTSSRNGTDWDLWNSVPDTNLSDQPWRRRGRGDEPVLISELFAGDPVLEKVAADQDRISRTKNTPGDAVWKVQQALLVWNPNCLPQWGADGNYGNETAEAVRNFKRDLLGVPVAQIIDDVGPATVMRLDKIQAAREGKLGTLTTLRFINEYGDPLANLNVILTNPDVIEFLTTDSNGHATAYLAHQSGLEVDWGSALTVVGNLTGRAWPPPGGYPPAHAILTPSVKPLVVNPGDTLDIVVATRVAVTATLVAPLAGEVRVEGRGAALNISADGHLTLALQATGGTMATVYLEPHPSAVGPLPTIPEPVGWTPLGTYTVRPGDTAEGLAEAFVGDPTAYSTLSNHAPLVGEVLTLPELPGWLNLVTAPVPTTAPVQWFSVSPDAIIAAIISAGDTRPLQDLLAVLDRPPAPDPDPLAELTARAEAIVAIISQPSPPLGVDREPEEEA